MTEQQDVKRPDEDEEIAKVVQLLGDNRTRVMSLDGTERVARIPGRMRKNVWIRDDDYVLIEPWEWQDEKADIVYRYTEKESDLLREEGLLEED